VKLLLDENLSHRLVPRLATIVSSVAHARVLGLRSDISIWEYAKENGYMIVTKDSDFKIFSMIRGHPPKVMLMAMGNSTVEIQESALRSRQAEIQEFANDDRSYLVIE
jgi:predicted nuclease of predicted toxin-antitoxin system